MPNDDYDTIRREEKLKGVENWSRWSNMTELILVEKGYWDIVTGSCTRLTDPTQVTVFKKESAGAARIIKGGLNDDLFKNVEDTNDSKEI